MMQLLGISWQLCAHRESVFHYRSDCRELKLVMRNVLLGLGLRSRLEVEDHPAHTG